MADTREEILRPLRPSLVPVPAPTQLGICPICHSSWPDEYLTCYPCSQAVYLNPPPILPITMSVAGGTVHRHLRMYKDAPDAGTRERLTMRLAALLSLFMEKHATCVGDWDIVTCVPSATRVAMAPVVAKLRLFLDRDAHTLAHTGGAGDHALDADQFEVVAKVRGRRVLLLDDTFTTGAKLFSAVAALRAAGAEIVGPVVIGRHVQESWGPSQAMMTWLADRQWHDSRCCRCGGATRDEGSLF